MKTLVVYSSLTGNTKKVVEKVFEIIREEKKLVALNSNENIDLNEYDRVIVGFWVDKGTADSRSKKFIKSVKGKEVAFIGTLGAEARSSHGQSVNERAIKLCSENNKFIGGFLCQGKVDPKLVEKMGKFPLKLIHPLTPERLKRIEDAKSHPNEDDFKAAQDYFKKILYNEHI